MARIPNRNQFAVTRPGWEAIRQTLYDFVPYVAAGHTTLSFFAVPQGQGTSWAGGGTKSLSDTNMTLAGQLPQGQEFLVQSIEIIAMASVTNPSTAAAVATLATIVNDQFIIRRGGNLTFTVLNKVYCQEAPLLRFPPKTNFTIEGGATSQAAVADNVLRFLNANAVGRPYLMEPPVKLASGMNFNITLNWPEGVQAVTNVHRIGIVLDGILYRQSQ